MGEIVARSVSEQHPNGKLRCILGGVVSCSLVRHGVPMTAPWITYRPELKVLDCTIRDGGLCNDHAFEDGFVKAVYEACVAAGIDYMEMGYKASKRLFARDSFGAWKFCDEDDLRRIVGDNPTPLKLAAMVDAGKSDWQTDVLPKKDSVLDLIRVAFYANQVSEAVDMIKRRLRQGLRSVGQPDGRLDRQGAGNRPGAGGARRDARQRAGGRRQLRLDVRRAGRDPGEEVSQLRRTTRARKWASTPTTTSNWPSPTRSRRSSTGPTASTPRWPAWAAAPATAPWNC